MMGQSSAKLRRGIGGSGLYLYYWCQGCGKPHCVGTGPRAATSWGWDGNIDAPTFSPSVLVTRSGPGWIERCHTFIRGGMVEFLSDCTHTLAGQTLPLPDWPYADGEYGGVEPLSS
jgi:hypothetical protein